MLMVFRSLHCCIVRYCNETLALFPLFTQDRDIHITSHTVLFPTEASSICVVFCSHRQMCNVVNGEQSRKRRGLCVCRGVWVGCVCCGVAVGCGCVCAVGLR